MSIVPRLNMDGKPHTPSFVLEPEKVTSDDKLVGVNQTRTNAS